MSDPHISIDALRRRLRRELAPARVEQVIADLTEERRGLDLETRLQRAVGSEEVVVTDVDRAWARRVLRKGR